VRFTLIAATPLAAVLAWVIALMVDPGIFSPLSVLLLGLGIISLTTIGTVGLILVGAKWAQRLLAATTTVTLYIALSRPIDVFSVVGLILTGASFVALYGPGSSRLVRKLPADSGPPARAVIVTLLGLSAPLLLGLVPAQPNVWVVVFAVVAPFCSFVYSRTIAGGLAMLRTGIPVVGLVLAPFMPVPHAIVSVVLAVSIGVLAWSKDVAIAFHPLIEKGTTYAIPPELAPAEILDGARIDERGKPL